MVVAVRARKLEVDALVAKRLVVVIPVVEALVILPFVAKSVCAVIPAEDEALARLVCPCTVKIPDAVTLVVEALARVVWPVTVSWEIVVVASVEVPVTTKVLVVVLLVAVRLVILARVVKKFVAVSPVVEALVRTDDDAKIFWVKVLRKRNALVPRV